MKTALIVFTIFLVTATISLVVVAEDQPKPGPESLQLAGAKELPPPLPGDFSIVQEVKRYTEAQAEQARHIGDCNNFTPIACRPCRKQGRPLGNVLRWLLRPGCRWGRWR